MITPFSIVSAAIVWLNSKIKNTSQASLCDSPHVSLSSTRSINENSSMDLYLTFPSSPLFLLGNKNASKLINKRRKPFLLPYLLPNIPLIRPLHKRYIIHHLNIYITTLRKFSNDVPS